jgi:predicted  nucleic acid-binding Zn-ribbon protein
MNSRKRKRNLNAVAVVNIGPLVRRSVRLNGAIKRNLTDARRRVESLRKHLDSFSHLLKDLEAQDKMGNFEIQDLMSRFNQAETLASNVLKKRDDTANAVIGKI